MATTPLLGTPLQWGLFLGAVLLILLIDLIVLNRNPKPVGLRTAALWTVFWVSLALLFDLWIYLEYGAQPALEFLAGYVIEEALSVDNLFVFLVIFSYFKVPAIYQHRVLFWGILGAIVLRGIFIYLGVELIERFHWIIYLFGAFLVVTGLRLLKSPDESVEPERNPVVRFFRRFVPMTANYDGQKFLTIENGKRVATPLLLVVTVVEATDLAFAVDSIPAVLAITREPFIVFTSNIFAILGLRNLFFLLANLMDRFHYLKYGLGLVLSFVGAKMLLADVYHLPVQVSLLVIVMLLGGSVLLSWLRPLEAAPPDE